MCSAHRYSRFLIIILVNSLRVRFMVGSPWMVKICLWQIYLLLLFSEHRDFIESWLFLLRSHDIESILRICFFHLFSPWVYVFIIVSIKYLLMAVKMTCNADSFSYRRWVVLRIGVIWIFIILRFMFRVNLFNLWQR